LALLIGLAVNPALAQKKYGPGVTDTEIKIGSTNPYSGPASAYGTIGRAETAYFAMINERGGVNGRKINFISLDDGYSPPRTVEQIRKLVEEEQVLFLAGTLGTPPNSAIHKYVNAKGVPHIFVNTGATKWGDPKNFPWTMGFNLNYQAEGASTHATFWTKPGRENRDPVPERRLRQRLRERLKDGLGDRRRKDGRPKPVTRSPDPSIDSQIVSLKASGADTFYNVTTPKFAAQAIRKVYTSAGGRYTSSTTCRRRSARC
jgi:ABC-type branched-subunit amino acid transport system substrate-binding protein